MTWRDLLFDSASNLVVAGPLRPERLARLDDDFRRWAMSADAAAFHFRRVGGVESGAGRWQPVAPAELPGRISAATVNLEDGAALVGLEAWARQSDHRELGVVLVISAPFAALVLSHAFSDGVVALRAVRGVFSGAGSDTGWDTESQPHLYPYPHPHPERVSRFPVLRSLVRTRQLTPAALLAARRTLHAGHRYLAVSPTVPLQADDAESLRSIASFSISTARISALAAVEQARSADPSGRRPASTAVLSALLFRSLRGCLAEGIDLPVSMPVGLRRHLGAGWTTAGNFARAPVVGTLREREWTADEFRSEVVPRMMADSGVAEYAYEGLAEARQRMRAWRARNRAASKAKAKAKASASATVRADSGATGATGAKSSEPELERGAPFSVSLNILTGGLGIAPDDYLPGEAPRPSLLMVVREGLLGPHVTVSATGREFVVTAVDDTGFVDMTRLETAVGADEASLLGSEHG